jgi:hypothetical protein
MLMKAALTQAPGSPLCPEARRGMIRLWLP